VVGVCVCRGRLGWPQFNITMELAMRLPAVTLLFLLHPRSPLALKMPPGLDDSMLVIDEEYLERVPPFTQESVCSSGYSCRPITQCPIMNQLMISSCLQESKLRGLSCGYLGSEPLVCCPQTCPKQTSKREGQTDCGKPRLHNWSSYDYKGLGAHPWAVRVGFKNKLSGQIEYLCGGSVIDKRVILTAAHCALAKTSTHKIAVVQVGEYDANQDPDCTPTFCALKVAQIPLSHIIVHPGYDAKSYRHNIALLVLKESLNYSVSAQPICIYPKSKEYIYVGHRATLVGWGKLSGQERLGGSKQAQLDLPVLPVERCVEIYGGVGTVRIEGDHLCVGGEGRDACTGFGGAPLVLLDPRSKDRYYQIGLLSFGSDKCGAQGIPSVYTRVDRYSDWITANSPKD